MKVVIDTNVLVSGLLTPFGFSAEILRLLINGSIVLCYDARILIEYMEVLNRPKFDFDPVKVDLLVQDIESIGELCVGVPLKKSLPDSDDGKFLEVALGGNAGSIITGNEKHFPRALCQGVTVCSPSEFMRGYSEGQSELLNNEE